MATSLTIKPQSFIDWDYQDVVDLATVRDDNSLRALLEFTNGTGNLQCNAMWHDRRRLTLATGTDDLDLAGGLEDVFGNTLTFTQIKLLFIQNKGQPTGSTWTTIAGQDLLVGAAASNAWGSFLDNSQTAKMRLRSGGFILLTAPRDGHRVLAGSRDVLRIDHDGSAASGGDIDYDIVVAGIA
jgi:hypothetical protein